MVLTPVLLIVAVLVRTKLGSPVIFCQERPGKDEKIFKMYKFRSMTDPRDENGELLPDEVRLTKFGRALRSTSLDELPELWNIFKGDMSIVGPRPQLVRDMVFMTPEQRLRHTVMPGLTGLAQVSGRNAISWEDKLATDLRYIRRITFLGDVKIVLLTVKKGLLPGRTSPLTAWTPPRIWAIICSNSAGERGSISGITGREQSAAPYCREIKESIHEYLAH